MIAHGQLVGRLDELTFVQDAIGAGRGVLVVGRAGIGKSRLVREALASVEPTTRVIRITGVQSASVLSFAAFAALWPASVPEAPRNDQLFVALRDAVVGTGPRPVLAVDDAHWLDDDSAALVQQLAQQGSVTLVACARSDEQLPSPLGALWRGDTVERLDLHALSRAESDELVVSSLGGPASSDALARVWSTASGVPLWTRELLLDAVDSGHLRSVRDLWVWEGDFEPGPRLVDVTGDRLARLSADARTMLRLVAFGEPLPIRLLGASPSAAGLDELEARQLLRYEGEEVWLAHPLHGEVLRAATPEPIRRSIRGLLATRWIEAGPVQGSELVRVARLGIDGDRPLDEEMLVAAAAVAYALNDFPLAERLSRAAPSQLRGLGGVVLGQSLQFQNRPDESRAALDAVQLDLLDDAERARWAMVYIDAVGFGLGDLEGAAEAADAASALIGAPRWRAFLQAQLAATHMVTGSVVEAERLAVPLLDHPDPHVRLRALSPGGGALVFRGRTDEALAHSASLVPDAMALRDELPHAVAWVFSVFAVGYSMSGEFDRLETLLAMADSASQVRAGHGFLLAIEGRLELMRGRPRTAVRLLLDAAAQLDRSGPPYHLRWTLSQAVLAHAMLDNAAAAAEAWQEADRLGPWGFSQFDRDAMRAVAWRHVAAGNLGLAITDLLAVADAERDAGFPTLELEALHDSLRLGAVAESAPRIISVAPRVDGRWSAACAAHAEAARLDDGERFDEASLAFEAMGATVHAAETAWAASQAHARRGLRAKATASAARCDRLRTACEGATTPGLAAESPSPLTRREREVASLAATGRTTPEIAASLGISRRTVETHLANLYAKLGVSDRRDLAPYV